MNQRSIFNNGSRPLHITLWVVQVGLALLYAAAGILKSTQPIPELSAMMHWPGDVPVFLVRFIGIAELMGAAGLIVPSLFRVAVWLTPLAALGLSLLQTLAIPFHLSRGESGILPLNIILLSLALFICWGRWKKASILPR